MTTPAHSAPLAAETLRQAEAAPPGGGYELNTFQTLMRSWKEFGPYNAAQVLAVSGPPALEQWQTAAQEIINELGLGRPHISPDELTVTFSPAAVEVASVTGSLQDHLNGELNRPFDAGDCPIHFFIMPRQEEGQAEERGGYYFGAVYDHWIADSRAVRALMQAIFGRFSDPQRKEILSSPADKNALPLTLENPPFDTLFRRHIGPVPALLAMWTTARNMWRHRQVFRVHLRDPLDFKSRVIYRALPQGLIQRIHRFASARQASVNDTFLAVLGQVMGEFTLAERYKKRDRRLHLRRDRIALGTIVDIRDAAHPPIDRVFGLYLSSYTIVLAAPEKKDAAALTSEIAIQTRRIKRKFTAVKAFLSLRIARMFLQRYPDAKARALFFLKNAPTIAGISNVNLTDSWVNQEIEGPAGDRSAKPRVLDYLRISPTGPLLPLAFTLTTIGDRLSLCVTFRTTAFAPEQATQLVHDFITRLNEVVP